MNIVRLVALASRLSTPSTTRLLVDLLTEQVRVRGAARGITVEVEDAGHSDLGSTHLSG